MIESRYKIEYIVPEEDVKKTSPFKMLWYLLLIPLIAVVVLGITYNFSVKDISRDSMVLLEKAKVHVFNLGDASKLAALEENKLEKTTIDNKDELNNKTVANKSKDVKSIAATVEIDKTEINKDKTTIFELSAAQELQLKTIKEQIAKNTELTNNLNSLSNQLMQEQIKNQSLNSRLAAQELDRLELEQEYYKALKNSEKSKGSIDNVATSTNRAITAHESELELIERDLPPIIPGLTKIYESTEIQTKSNAKKVVEKSETDKIIEAMATVNPSINATESKKSAKTQQSEVSKVSIDEIAKSTIKTIIEQETELELIERDLAPIISEISKVSDSPVIETESNLNKVVEKSETDKIIEAMATVNPSINATESKKPVTPRKALEPTLVKKENFKTEIVKDLPEDVVINTEQVTSIGAENEEIKKVSAATIQAEATEAVSIKPVEVSISLDFNDEQMIAVKNEIKAIEKESEVIEKTIEKETKDLATKEVKPEPTIKPKEVSSVDAIIAAMQDVKSEVTDKTLSSNQKAEQKSAETADQ